ncbi:hypothetical protein DB29_01126 [Shouchella clausii]|nr:hypothetical protein DB29_01126 [Shouchella clausii]
MAKKVLNETNIQNQNMFFTLKNVFLALLPINVLTILFKKRNIRVTSIKKGLIKSD